MAELSQDQWRTLHCDLWHVYRGSVPPGARRLDNRNPHWACYRLNAGSLHLTIDGVRHHPRINEWLILPPDRHRRQDFSDDARILSINLDAVWSDGRPLFWCPQGILLGGASGAALDRAALRLLEDAAGLCSLEPGRGVVRHAVDLSRWLAARAGLMRFLAVWYAVLIEAGVRVQSHRLDDERVARALTELDPRKVGRTVPYATLSDRCDLSRSQIDRLFQEHLGRRPKQVIEDRCLALAQRALAAGDEPIKALASRLGFTDAAHFGRWFRHRCGRTPGAYRRQPGV